MKREAETAWTSIATLTTSEDGSISTPITIGGSAEFRLTTTGTWERAESTSNVEPVTVRPKLILERPATVQHGKPIRITGKILPGTSGSAVELQRMVAGSWQNIRVSTVTDTNGDFSLETSEATRGILVLRVQIISGGQEINSPEFSIVVR
jgi:5-hydroxyisourate hydrolase-like protein (transthyretin family)